MSDPAAKLINLQDYEQAARRRLPRMVYDYYASGAHDEITLRENHAAFDRIRLRYRVLRDISQRNLNSELLGRGISLPAIAAPTAFHALADPDGELATARAVAAAGTIMVASTLATRSIEEICGVDGEVWFQLYIYKDRGITRALVERARQAGCRALVLTVDTPMVGVRERDVRNQFHLPPGIEVQNLLPAGLSSLPQVPDGSGLAAYTEALFDPALSWSDVDWLTTQGLPVWVKGIVHPEDAELAIAHGARGVWVSNHGGRQLDTAPPTIEVLAEIAEKVDGRAEIVLDGGVRRGTDMIKAVALGANAVALGRPLLWGLAADGEAGVLAVLELLRRELDLALGLCGCRSLAEVGPDLLLC